MATWRVGVALLVAALAVNAAADGATTSFAVTLRVLPRIRTGLPGGQRPAFVGTVGSPALPCGAENSAACSAAAAAAARNASPSSAPVVLTVLPDGSPTAIFDL